MTKGLFEFIALGDGKSFGEMALINNRPRGASILCKQDTYFAVMDKDNFKSTLMKVEERQQDTYIDFLSKLHLITFRKNSTLQFMGVFSIVQTAFCNRESYI